MTKDNGLVTMSEKEIDKLADEAELEMDDPSLFALPPEMRIETLAPLALNHMQTLAQCEINIAANQRVNKQEVERLTNLQTASLVALTKIRKECPEAIAAAKVLAKEQAKEAKRLREQMGQK